MAAVVLAAAFSFPYSGEEGILTLRYSRNAPGKTCFMLKKIAGLRRGSRFGSWWWKTTVGQSEFTIFISRFTFEAACTDEY